MRATRFTVYVSRRDTDLRRFIRRSDIHVIFKRQALAITRESGSDGPQCNEFSIIRRVIEILAAVRGEMIDSVHEKHADSCSMKR